MKLPLADIVRGLDGLRRTGRPVLVGMDGGAGAGKTTFARRLADGIAAAGVTASVVHADGFYKCAAERWSGPVERQPIGHDLDWERLRDQVLDPLRSGEPSRYRPFDWPGDRLLDWVHVEPEGIVIVEGVFCLRSELSDLYDLRIWVACPQKVREKRVLSRGDMTPEELVRWMPGEAAYVAAHAPDRHAHLVVDGAMGAWPEHDTDWIDARRGSPP